MTDKVITKVSKGEIREYRARDLKDEQERYSAQFVMDVKHNFKANEMANVLAEMFCLPFDAMMVARGGLDPELCKAYGYARFLLDKVGRSLSEEMTELSEKAYADALNKQVKL